MLFELATFLMVKFAGCFPLTQDYTVGALAKHITALHPSDLKNKFVHHQQFDYMLKDVICPQGAFVVVLIKSEPERFKEREDVRNTWGSVTKVKGKKLVPVFTMGRSAFPLKEVDESLSLESERFKDIIQGDFVDHFKNKAYKTIMGLSWVVNSCLDVKFVLNTNDETMIDPFHMVDFLELQENADLLFCSTFYDQGPERNPSEKLFVTYKEFSYDRFPPHCDGFAYIMSYSTAFKILEAAKETPFFWLDDVFVTGLLALKAAITHTDMPANHTYNLMQLEHIAGDLRSSMFLVAKIPALRAHWDHAWNSITSLNKSLSSNSTN